MSTHHNFDHAEQDFIPQGGDGRTMRLHFSGRDWIGVIIGDNSPNGGFNNIYHLPSPNGLDTEGLKNAGWALSFE